MQTKKRILVLQIILLCTLIGNAQYTREVNSVDLVLGGDFGYRTISGEISKEGVINSLNNRALYEAPKLNYRFGLNYNIGIRKLSARLGLRYANPGFAIAQRIEKINIEEDINDITKVYDSNGKRYKYKYQIIEVPIGIRYILINTICQPYFEIGLSPTIYHKTIIEEIIGLERTGIKYSWKEQINTMNYIGFASVGGNFNITENVSGFTQMIGRYQVNNLRKRETVEKLIGIGLEIGIRYFIE